MEAPTTDQLVVFCSLQDPVPNIRQVDLVQWRGSLRHHRTCHLPSLELHDEVAHIGISWNNPQLGLGHRGDVHERREGRTGSQVEPSAESRTMARHARATAAVKDLLNHALKGWVGLDGAGVRDRLRDFC